jgi:hypothetical protein
MMWAMGNVGSGEILVIVVFAVLMAFMGAVDE